MKVGIIVCGRMENKYAIEFVEYYKKLGFNQIFILDNNYTGEEKFEDVLMPYIKERFVTIFNCRNRPKLQNYILPEHYKYISTILKYDYLFFIDFDEYLVLTQDNTIQEYLSRPCFNGYNQILINWKLYGDNGHIYYENKPLQERFTKESDIDNLVKILGWNENILIKPILKGGIKNIYQQDKNHHFFLDKNKIIENTTCNSIGEKTKAQAFVDPIKYDLAYIKHYTTKTIDEYINNKCVRGVGDRSMKTFNNTYGLKRFFMYNEVTKEKLDYLKNHKIDVSEWE